MATDQAADRSPVSIVGIGASAGGIKPLQSLFAALPSDLGHAYVVIVPLMPDRRSELSDIIARYTGMPVCEVRGSIDLEPDHVYVISPNCMLEFLDSSISASEFDQPGQRVIDTFFCSLAERHGDKFAVILSGVGAEGALGARALKERGGVILVQDPAEALHPSMPEAAIATGAADVIGPVEELAEKLIELTQNRQKLLPILRSVNNEKPLGKKATEQVSFLRALERGNAMASPHSGTVEEVRKANAELQTLNAEYCIIMEELLISQDELRSVNEELQTLNDALIERMNVIEVNEANLKRLTAELREQDAAKEDFLSLLGHELRNPLAAIRNSLEAMQRTRDFEAEDAVLRSGSFDIIDRQSKHMIRLVNDLLDINRINRGKLELSLESIDVRDCIEHVTKALGAAIGEANLNLELDLPESELRVRGDPERMLQILDNLLRNAIQFTDRGGRVLIHARQENGKGRISVKDSGVGMVPEQIESLFEPYQQAEPGRGGGLGLGLSLSRYLVELHGGKLTARSDGPGGGSEFVIELELADASECHSSQDESGESASPPQWRVLVVDDDEDNAQSMSILLESLGQECRVALDGISALALVREFKPHIVFQDLTMPGMSGFEVARRLRSKGSADWPVKLVALSGLAEKTTPVNFDHYLMKPAAIEDILDLLDSLSHD